MIGVFNLRENRQKARNLFKGRDIEIILFKPEYTDDNSEEHDATEEGSESDKSSSEVEGQKYSDEEK
jgi:hypothetical protein